MVAFRLCLPVVLVVMCFRGTVDCKTSFVKDQKTDFVFPPVNIHSISGMPDGHLRPLGWQRKPEGKIREEKDPVSPPTFQLRYVKNGRPAVFRQTLKGEPVVEKWEEDSYLKQKYGKVNVTITMKKELKVTRTKRRMLFRKFLLDYMYENWYLSSTVHEQMLEELPLPQQLSCGSYKERLTETELWMSSGGTSSLLHSHGDHNMHCVLDGRKDFLLIESKHKEIFDVKETYPNSGSGSSPLDTDMINAFKYPKIAKVPWTWSTLWQGDCLYVPAGYLHHVRSYGRGISYTVQFAPSVDFTSSDCKEEETKGKRKKKDKKENDKSGEEEKKLMLSDVNFIWAYSDGERHLHDKALVPETLRRILLLLMRDGDQFHQNQFEHFYEEALEKDASKPPADEIFHIMTPNDTRTYVSRDEIKALAPSRLQHICDVFNKMHKRVHDEL